MRTSCILTMMAVAPFLAACDEDVERTVPPAAVAPANANDDAQTILGRYAAAWRGSEEMELPDGLTLGFDIAGEGGGTHHIVISPDGEATLQDGLSSNAYVTFLMDIDYLRRLDRDEVSALTSVARARMSDETPLNFRFPEGFRLTPDAMAFLLPLGFHFWNRSWPETIRFGDGTTRHVHGGNSAIFYYDRGLRTSWYQLEPGMHINADPELQANPFPSLFIMTRGQIRARLDGIERVLSEGEAVFVPAGMPHEFWADERQYGELVLIMFGEGA